MKGLMLMFPLLWLAVAPAGAQQLLLEYNQQMSISVLQQLTQPYFKILPYNKSFSSFLQQVIGDPDLQEAIIKLRTDSTFYYASGTYQRHNPFIYRPSQVRVIIAESEFSMDDSSGYRDTIIYYQLLVTTDTTPKARQFVEKEYTRLLRKASRNFTHKTYTSRRENSPAEGSMTHSFISPFAVAPLTITWGREANTQQYALSLALCLKVKENRAGMVTLPQELVPAPN